MKCEKFVRPAGPMKFTWDYCALCDTMMVRCPNCNNNCCNAAFGEVDGKKCDVCNLAYQYQHMAWKHHDHPEFFYEEKEGKRKELDRYMEDMSKPDNPQS